MGRLLRCAIVLLMADSTMVNFGVFATSTSVAEAFQNAGLVPDLIPTPPSGLVEVKYPGGAVVNLGNELSPTQTQVEPQVSYEADENSFYTLIMTDPDVPSRELPTLREFRHWLVVNIRGCDVSSGETLSSYIGPTPPPATGLHRYTFLVYKQPGKMNFNEPLLSNVNRTGFSSANFAKNNGLGDPIAGNFFLSQFPISVPIVGDVLG